MVVFMIMASQFKSLRLPFVMLFTIPVSLVGIVLALMAAGQGFSITALMGILMVIGIAVSNGILLVDDANRRYRRGGRQVEAIVAAARSRFVPIAMTSLATVIGLIPTAMGARARLGGQPAPRARRRRRAHLVHPPVPLPRAGDVPLLRRKGRGPPKSIPCPEHRLPVRSHEHSKFSPGSTPSARALAVLDAAAEMDFQFDATLHLPQSGVRA